MSQFKLKPWHASEASIKHCIISYLTILEKQGKLMFLRNNSFAGVVKGFNGKESYIRNGKLGSSDLIVFRPGGRVLLVEIKSPVAKQSVEQQDWQERIEQLGYEYCVVRSVDDVIRAIQAS